MASQLIRYLHGDAADIDAQAFTARRSANLILWLVLGFAVVLILWAALTEVDRTVRSVGRVVPTSKLQVVSNLEGGIVEQILVKPGQPVRKGDVLVRLSPTLSSAAYGSSAVEVAALETRIARLDAEVRGTAPEYGLAPADQLAVEKSLHSARAAELAGIDEAGRAREAQAERAVAEAQALLVAQRANLVVAEREQAMIAPLAERGFARRMDLVKADNQALVARSAVGSAEAAIARARSGIAEAHAEAARQRSTWLTRAGMELSQAQADLAVKKLQLPALSDRVERTTIRAPMSGKVNRVLVTTIGGSVAAGQTVAEIVPSDQTLYVEALVRPSDIANVRLGQRAKIEITAYNASIFGNLEGRVTSISPDAVVNEQTGESFYTVEVQTVSALRDGQGRKLPIGPGMIAAVSLLGEKRSVLSYLFTPISRLSETAFRE